MVKAELIMRSPLRALERSLHGGLGKGNIGVLASRKGVGKTACLVHLATDKLFQDKPVIHISYASRVDYIINWYKDIFKEIAGRREFENALNVHDELIKNRVIMNFKQDAARTDQVLKSVEAMIVHARFAADCIIVDGYNFADSAPEDLRKFRDFARKNGLEVWFSASLKGTDPLFDDRGIPYELEKYIDEISVLVTLQTKGDRVQLHLVKNHDYPSPGELRLQLDPRTLLIAEDR
jgi:hypothetical protein